MKLLFLFTAMLIYCSMTIGQSMDNSDLNLDEHKIIIQLTSGDTNIHKMVVRQLGNLLTAAPNSKIEVVCHASGISMLMTQQTKVQSKIAELKLKGVDFVACENTMRERKITKEEIIPEAGYVKVGMLEIVLKEEAGWSYLRAAQ